MEKPIEDQTPKELFQTLARVYSRLAETQEAPREPQDDELTTEEAWRLVGEASADTFLRRTAWRLAVLGRRRPLKWSRVELLKIKAGQAKQAIGH
jgi:hypothetical protein